MSQIQNENTIIGQFRKYLRQIFKSKNTDQTTTIEEHEEPVFNIELGNTDSDSDSDYSDSSDASDSDDSDSDYLDSDEEYYDDIKESKYDHKCIQQNAIKQRVYAKHTEQSLAISNKLSMDCLNFGTHGGMFDLFSVEVPEYYKNDCADENDSRDIDRIISKGGRSHMSRKKLQGHKKRSRAVLHAHHKDIIIKGHVQSGKTSFMLATAVNYVFKNKVSSIIVLRNATGDKCQIKSRLAELEESLKNHLDSENIDSKLSLNMLTADVSDNEFEKAMTGIKPQIFVVLGNCRQIEKINEKIENVCHGTFALFIDEADSNEAGTSKRTCELAIMRENAVITFHVSATILNIGLTQDIEKNCIIMLRTSNNYLGHEKIHHNILEHDMTEGTKIDDDPSEKDPNMKDWLAWFALQAPYKHRSGMRNGKHPRNCLMNICFTIEPQKKLFRYIAELHDIVVILYNGEGVDIYHPSLEGSAIEINGIRSMPCTWFDKAHSFDAKVGISNVYQMLKDNGGADRFPRVITISGQVAGRGISFVSADYGKYLKSLTKSGLIGWRLTDMYFTTAPGTHQPALLQRVGRLCCNVIDSFPTILHSTQQTSDDVDKSYNIQEEYISRIKDSECKYIGEIIRSAKIHKDKPPSKRRNLTQNYRIAKDNLVDDDSMEDGAFSLQTYGITETPATLVLNDKAATTKQLTSLLKAYKKTQGKVRKIIDFFMANNWEPQKVSAIRNSSEKLDKINVTNYDRWETRGTKYKILIKDQENKYKINDEVLRLLEIV